MPTIPKLREVTWLIPMDLYKDLEATHATAQKAMGAKCPKSMNEFVLTVLNIGMGVLDSAKVADERKGRLVLSPTEAMQEAKR